jgi:hypothetical protein
MKKEEDNQVFWQDVFKDVGVVFVCLVGLMLL